MTEATPEAPAVQAHLERTRRRALRALLPAGLAGLDTLELGCGAGDFVELLALERQEIDRLVGLDLDAERVTRAAQRFPAARFEVADIRQADLGAERFDLVVFSQVLSQIAVRDQRREVLLKAARALRSGGRILVHDMLILRRRTRKRGFSRFAPGELADCLPEGFRLQASLRCSLLPPLLRLVAPRAPDFALRLERLPLLRGHWMALLSRSGEA